MNVSSGSLAIRGLRLYRFPGGLLRALSDFFRGPKEILRVWGSRVILVISGEPLSDPEALKQLVCNP